MPTEELLSRTDDVSCRTSSVTEELILNLRASKDYRSAYVEEKIRSGVAAQIKAIREKQGLTQAELARKLGKTQSWVARLEDPNQTFPTVPTLLRVAEALDVDLDVSFVSFSRGITRLTSLTPQDLVAAKFSDEFPD